MKGGDEMVSETQFDLTGLTTILKDETLTEALNLAVTAHWENLT